MEGVGYWGGVRKIISYRGGKEIHKSAEMCSSLARRASLSVASGRVTLFVVGAKTVNKVGGWITEPLSHHLNHRD